MNDISKCEICNKSIDKDKPIDYYDKILCEECFELETLKEKDNWL